MHPIKVCYSVFENEEMALYFDRLLMTVPKPTRDRVLRYKQPKDRHLVLLGRLLLLRALSSLAPSVFIEDIAVDKFGRPFLVHRGIDFNISHSGCFAVCALSWQGRVGIDIERKREINLEGFKRHMTETQWHDIHTSPNSLDRFFYYWTLKEAVVKADGRGLRVPLALITTDADRANLEGTVWHVKELQINTNYACHLATDRPIRELYLQPYKLRDFLSPIH
jgi:4'-phosphopantetheinyl transferase